VRQQLPVEAPRGGYAPFSVADDTAQVGTQGLHLTSSPLLGLRLTVGLAFGLPAFTGLGLT